MDRDDPSTGVRSQTQTVSWAFFVCGERGFAVRLDHVHEIVPPQPVTRVPGCGSEVYGLIGLRGRVITVFDYGFIAGGTASAEHAAHRLVLIRHGDRVVGLAVDQLVTITSPGDMERLDDALVVDPHGDEAGLMKIDGRTFTILDPDRVFGSLLA